MCRREQRISFCLHNFSCISFVGSSSLQVQSAFGLSLIRRVPFRLCVYSLCLVLGDRSNGYCLEEALLSHLKARIVILWVADAAIHLNVAPFHCAHFESPSDT